MIQLLKFSVFFLFFLQTVLAQDENRFSVSLAAGPSISLRKVATKVTGTQRGELAGDGWAAQAGVTYRFLRNFGITARLSYNQNSTRKEGIELVAINNYNIANPNVANAADWSALSLLAGPSVHIFIGKLALEGRLVGGYASVKGPDFSVSGKLAGRDISVVTSTKTAQNFAFGIGGTLRFALSNHFSVALNGDYTQANAEFKSVENQVKVSGISITPTSPVITQNVGVLNVTGGIVLSF